MTNTTQESYDRLLEKYTEFNHLQSAKGVLEWDQYVMMPEGSTSTRSKQMSTLSSLAQNRITDSEFGELLDELDGDELSEEEQAVTREIRREYDKATRVPAKIEEELSELTSKAQSAWNEAKDSDDFSVFAPHLKSIVEKKREYANAINPDADPYETLVADFFPQVEYDTVERTLLKIENELVPLLKQIQESEVELNTDALHGDYDDDEQLAVARDLLELLGYDWSRGRLDTFDMPFTFGLPSDARICTWTDRSLYQTLWTTAHEGGHAFYAQGLPEDEFGTPLGEARGTFVHESQSSFWECHVFGNRAFWEAFLPSVTERFPDIDATPEEAYESVNSVRERNPLWVEADELTGQIHILLRFEIERDLINGEITVDEVPNVWNDRTEEYFGMRPETVEEGCLQDIHWSIGNIGYFPTYTLGHVLSAQVAAALERDIGDIGELIREGDFAALLEWQREHVHQHGQRYTTPELIRKVTGEDLSADYFIKYVSDKYTDLYDL
ncbi:carboxypeptidase M32 [Haloarcula amylolytica]|uniref:Metal-dependent carboxypeptidase n=1 Tax=Haloarcula amylolytica JCM 13557 TaxID=1227452 RepID=M0K8A9_9EURY|nr:carboxypeptidase M32 [Haloarcula amylolytica]EMA17033.1 carboxypeptidase Taq [Haloarcula amylolytica JCM 13557]